MKNVFLLTLAVLSLSACVGEGYPGDVPNIDHCYPGHESSKDCLNRRHFNP